MNSRLVSTIAAAAAVLMVGMFGTAGMAAAQQPAAAQSMKIGYVNTERVLREARASKLSAENIEAEFKKREREIAAGPARDVERRKAALMEDFNQRRDDAVKQFIEKGNAAIRRVGERENYDAVFIEAAYADKRIDITDKVIKALDSER
jgi:outer membrane protein